MNPVVIRCPNCGSGQDTLGECETCHEATARYYCPNHAPGRWLDEPACEECGARFGVEPRRPRAPAPVATPRPPSRSVEWRPPSTTTPDAADPTRAELTEWLEGMRRAPRRPMPLDLEPDEVEGPEGRWVTIDPGAAAGAVARGAFGCVARLILIFVVIAVLVMLALGGFVGGFDDQPQAASAQLATQDLEVSPPPAA